MTSIGFLRKPRQRQAPNSLRRLRVSALAGGLLLALASTAALAETLDFNQCVELALKQNPGLSATQSQIAQAEAAAVA